MYQKQYIIYLSNKICLFINKSSFNYQTKSNKYQTKFIKKEIYCNDFGSIQSKR